MIIENMLLIDMKKRKVPWVVYALSLYFVYTKKPSKEFEYNSMLKKRFRSISDVLEYVQNFL